MHNYQKKLKALKFQTPYDFLLLSYQNQPHLFKDNPNHKLAGLNKLEIEKLEGQIKNLSFENKGLDSLKAEIERFSVKDDNPTLQEEIFHLLSIHKKLTTLEITKKLPKKNKTSGHL